MGSDILQSGHRNPYAFGKCNKKWRMGQFFAYMSLGLNSPPRSCVVSHYDSFLMNHFMLLLLLQLYVINVKEPSFYFAQVLGRFFFYCLL